MWYLQGYFERGSQLVKNEKLENTDEILNKKKYIVSANNLVLNGCRILTYTISTDINPKQTGQAPQGCFGNKIAEILSEKFIRIVSKKLVINLRKILRKTSKAYS